MSNTHTAIFRMEFIMTNLGTFSGTGEFEVFKPTVFNSSNWYDIMS